MLKVYPLNGGRMLRDGAEALVQNHVVHGGESSLKLSVLVERDEDGYYVGSVLELPGCHTQARTLDDLLRRIREAIELYLEAEGKEELNIKVHSD